MSDLSCQLAAVVASTALSPVAGQTCRKYTWPCAPNKQLACCCTKACFGAEAKECAAGPPASASLARPSAPSRMFGDLTCAAWGRLGAQHARQAAWCRAGLLPEDAIRHAGWPCLAPG